MTAFSGLIETWKIHTKHTKACLICRYLVISVAIVNIECVHGLHNGHDGLQGVAVDDGNELQAFFKRVTIFVDNSDEKKVC